MKTQHALVNLQVLYFIILNLTGCSGKPTFKDAKTRAGLLRPRAFHGLATDPCKGMGWEEQLFS